MFKRFIAALLFVCSALLQATPQEFDQLVSQIERGERYFISLDDYQRTLQELETALPANDERRSHMLDRLRCTLVYATAPEAGRHLLGNHPAQAALARIRPQAQPSAAWPEG